ncbi:MAG TPA: dienelactone hydrolase family protein [Acidimicrobiia bacterium]|jgi:carboxymethylenebutenolidase
MPDRAEDISIQGPSGDVPAFAAVPDGPARGGIVVIQEAFGLTGHIKSICNRLADAGWTAVAPALFHRSSAPAPVFEYDDFEGLMPVMGSLTADGLTSDVDAAFSELERRGITAEQSGIVGFCMGGSVTLATAARKAVGAAVTFYGGGLAQGRFGYPALLSLGSSIRTPWLGLFGDRDQGIPAQQVERLRVAAESAPVPTEIVRYPDAQHGFNCDDRPAVYNEAAASDAWRRTLAWFDNYCQANNK